MGKLIRDEKKRKGASETAAITPTPPRDHLTQGPRHYTPRFGPVVPTEELIRDEVKKVGFAKRTKSLG